MALGLQTTGNGEGAKPFVKYDARAGRMFMVNRSQGGDGMWQSENIDITSRVEFIPDLANIQVGWINYSDKGPIRIMGKLGQPIPPKPTDVGADGKPIFKQGFSLQLAMPKDMGGGLREFGSTAGCVIEAIDQLHDAFLGAPESKSGHLPVVGIASTMPVKSGQSTNYKPVFEIKAWVQRPAAFDATGATTTIAPVTTAAPVTTPSTTIPPATGATQMPPPASRPAVEPAAARDFG